jgi:hypothetical protein
MEVEVLKLVNTLLVSKNFLLEYEFTCLCKKIAGLNFCFILQATSPISEAFNLVIVHRQEEEDAKIEDFQTKLCEQNTLLVRNSQISLFSFYLYSGDFQQNRHPPRSEGECNPSIFDQSHHSNESYDESDDGHAIETGQYEHHPGPVIVRADLVSG